VKSMTAFVQSLTKRKCLTVFVTTSLEEVVRILARNSIGALVVVSKNRKIEGIVSERDIVRRLSWGVTINDLTASDVMTKDVISVTTNVTSSDLMQVMTENKCRHLPIVSGSRLVGMVSIGDVVKRLLEKYNAEVEQMRSFINS
jgi:CBS domain-containing protein